MQILQMMPCRQCSGKFQHAATPCGGAANLKASPLPPAPFGRLMVDIFVDASLDNELFVTICWLAFLLLFLSLFCAFGVDFDHM